MPRVNYRSSDVDLMARMMRAEAEGEGKQGMLYVGNVIVNRVKANCLDFKDLRTIPQVIFQVQGGNYSFEAVQKGNVFYQRARTAEKRLAKQNLDYWRQHPGKFIHVNVLFYKEKGKHILDLSNLCLPFVCFINFLKKIFSSISK